MPFVPAVCYNCHTIFSSGLFVKDIQTNLSGIEASGCPTCQNKGRIIGGLYEFIEYTLTILKEQKRTVVNLQQLYTIIRKTEMQKMNAPRLKDKIARNLPEYTDLLILLPETEEDYHLCLSVLTQVLRAVLTMSLDENSPYGYTNDYIKIAKNIKVNQAIDQIYTLNTGTNKRFL